MQDGDIVLDISTLTMGEAKAVELASGQSMQELLRSKMATRLMAIFVHELRHSDKRRSWQELESLRVLDVRSSTSRSQRAAASQTSKG